jgi:hypothetical protein
MKSLQFKYKGDTYECIGDDKEWQIVQFNFCIEVGDFQTLEHRIINQLKHHGPALKMVREETEIKETAKFW